MKRLITVLISTFTTAAFAAPTTLATYECGANRNSTVRVLKDADTYRIAISYVSIDAKTQIKHVVNIVSAPDTIDTAAEMFSANVSVANDALPVLTKLPAESVAFKGFHYPNGEMYVVSEGDSNEEGYIFAADKALLSGETSAYAAELFWSEFHPTEVSKTACSRVK